MEYRPLGRTGHHSSVAVLGGCAFATVESDEAAALLQMALDAGVNHLDIAPSYGHAETAIGPHLPVVRDRLFIGCKTMERSRDGARRELEGSLERLHTDHVDVYQFHAVTSHEELDLLLAPGGAAETFAAARDEGLTRFLGITGHFEQAPAVFLRMLDAMDLDTVMFMVNPAMWALPDYRSDAERLLDVCAERGVGVVAIKAVARGFWPEGQQRYRTWYEPLDELEAMTEAVRFALSLPVTAFATPCDPALLPAALRAAEAFTPLGPEELEEVVRDPGDRGPLVRPAS